MMSIQLNPQNPVIGGSVTLNVTGITDGIRSFSWYKGPTSSSQLQIFTYIPGESSPLVRGPSYNIRITAFPNGSLQISDLQTTDRGNYIVKVQTQKALESNLVLVIYDPVSKPVITVSDPEPQEDDTITLTCASSNTARIIWSKGGGPLPSGAVLSSNNKTVTFSKTNRSDSGEYRCTAENIASTKTSDSYTLAIAYGPENVNIKGSSEVTIGSVVSLVCVAESFPIPIYSWQLNGRNLTLHHNYTLLIEQITSMNEGNYTCEVKNLATKRSASASMFITVTVLLGVLVDVSSGMMSIQLIPQNPVIGGSVTLNVTGITDGIRSFSWYKGPTSSSQLQIFTYIPGDSSPLVRGPSYNIRITAFPNGSLQISDLQTTDRGNYIVKVQTQKALESNLVLVIYDPVSKPVITVSDPEPQEDDTITLTCASSNTARIIWSKGGGPLPSGAVLSSNNKTVTFSKTNRSDSGEYRCTAENIASTKISDSYTLAIAYGPENVNIKGSSEVTIGSVVSLVCVAESFPIPIYSWQLNGRNLTLHHNYTLLIEQITSMNEGNYTCEVKNLATKRSASASMFITVTVLLGVLVDVSSGMMSIQLIPQNPVIGGSVTLNVTGITDGIRSFSWYKGPTSSSQLQIFTYIPGDSSPLVRGPSYNIRITAFPNGSLQISDLQTTDRGNYIVKVQTQKALESNLVLVIYDPVSKPVITVSDSEPQEDDTITLTCASSNTARIIWSKGGGPLPSGAVLSSNNKTVTFSKTNRSDSGEYRCTAENIASTKISDSYTLAIACEY
ncbi:carcinoembryonic antigen-related cell adhesion molecule 5-like [Rana temporaria]|uniref:carcinoembryonic antigen-related cell adhesion molecule 5-like n=1 Tax=Rana temporaria TaxID=8407 RepID=UPI001AAD953A|nr:carcinoembryonic antigen-related cell adhesion molecule 5-like [Rana temporaria]